mgnify:FL=1
MLMGKKCRKVNLLKSESKRQIKEYLLMEVPLHPWVGERFWRIGEILRLEMDLNGREKAMGNLDISIFRFHDKENIS